MEILRVLAAKGVKDSPQLGGLRAHLRLLSNVWHTYCFTKLFHRHGQKLIVNSKLNSISIRIISETINEIGGEFFILNHTACCKTFKPALTQRLSNPSYIPAASIKVGHGNVIARAGLVSSKTPRARFLHYSSPSQLRVKPRIL